MNTGTYTQMMMKAFGSGHSIWAENQPFIPSLDPHDVILHRGAPNLFTIAKSKEYPHARYTHRNRRKCDRNSSILVLKFEVNDEKKLQELAGKAIELHGLGHPFDPNDPADMIVELLLHSNPDIPSYMDLGIELISTDLKNEEELDAFGLGLKK